VVVTIGTQTVNPPLMTVAASCPWGARHFRQTPTTWLARL
jgi:hypothetical protein